MRLQIELTDEKSSVTGTCQLFNVIFPNEVLGFNGKTKNISFLCDCGTFQGEENCDDLNSSFFFDISKPEFGILTHGHLDHYGRYPMAINRGFYGPVFTTYITAKFLSNIFLDDCLKIETRNADKKDIEPLFDEGDIKNFKKVLIGCTYQKNIVINDYINMYFFDNGHVPGAAVVLLQFTYPGCDEINIVISGDYNNFNTFFKVNPLPQWVYDLPNLTIIIESTYGNIKTTDLKKECFVKNITNALKKSKVCIVPTFSFCRCQEVLLKLREAQQKGVLDCKYPIYLDGGTAIDCTSMFMKGAFKMLPRVEEFLPQNCIFVGDKDLRNFLKSNDSPKIILSSSGMGSYGPSQGYIDSFINNKNAIIHATGYVTPDSKIGKLKAEKVNAKVYDTTEFSAHAKQDVLIEKFLKPFNFKNVKSIIVTHGSPEAKDEFAKVLTETFKETDVNITILSNDNKLIITSEGVVKTIPRLIN